LNAARLVYTSQGRVRAVWRLVAFVLFTLVALAVLQVALRPFAGAIVRSVGQMTAEGWILVLGLIVGHAASLHVIDRRGWDTVALDPRAARPAALLGGALLGVAAIGIPIGLLLAVGWLRIVPTPDGSWWGVAARVTAVLAPAALYEELLMRGYFFAVLRESVGGLVALLVTSVVFGLLHLQNPGADVRSTLIVTLAGFFLGGVLLATRSLYAAWMAHLGWNWAMAVLFHAPVSGLPFATPDYQTVDAGPDWATGGSWGPEGGAGAALGMAAGLLLLILWRGRSRGTAGHFTSSLLRPGRYADREESSA
jgi:membrane protease YdiL (CAAX protease family)